jgi:tetratricopeptide (TPR) repeat protein
MSHPAEDLLIQFALGVASDDEIESHLCLCSDCAREVEALRNLAAEERPHDRDRLDSLVRLERQLDQERDDALRALAALELRGVNLEDTVLSENALHSAGGIQVLLNHVAGVRRSDPSAAVQLGRIALRLVVSLPTENLSIPRNHLQVDALREYASSRRAIGDYEDSLRLLEEAEGIAETLVVGDYEIARLRYERARTYLDFGECEKAREWARSAAETFALFGDQRRVNRSRYLMAGCLYYELRNEEAVKEFSRLLPRLEEDGDLQSLVVAWNALGHLCARLGRPEEGRPLLYRALELSRREGMQADHLRARWGLGLSDLSKGEYDPALAPLGESAEGFEAIGLLEEAALVKLDLAQALLVLGRLTEAEAACRQSLDVLSSRLPHRAQKRALASLREIVESRELSPEALDEMGVFLYASRFNPSLSFGGSALPPS